MLVISRKSGEKFRIGEDVAIAVLEISGSRVVLGIEAPRDIPVRRLDQRSTSESDHPSLDDAAGQDADTSAAPVRRLDLAQSATDGPERAAAPFEYPARASDEAAFAPKKAPLVRIRRSRKIPPETDPSVD